MPLTRSTFDTGVVTALVDRLRAYLDGLGDDCRAKVVAQWEPDVQEMPLVVVSPSEMEEVVYQSGHYRVAVEVMLKVDANTGGSESFLRLSGALLDALQQDDLAAQLTAVLDATGRAYCVVQGLVLEQSRLEDVADWQLRRVYSLNLFGCAPLS